MFSKRMGYSLRGQEVILKRDGVLRGQGCSPGNKGAPPKDGMLSERTGGGPCEDRSALRKTVQTRSSSNEQDNLTEFRGQHGEAVALNVQLLQLQELPDLLRQRDQVIIPDAELRKRTGGCQGVCTWGDTRQKHELAATPPSWRLESPIPRPLLTSQHLG